MPRYQHLLGRVIQDTWIINGKSCTYEGYIINIYKKKSNPKKTIFRVRFADDDEIEYTYQELKSTLTKMYYITKAYFDEDETLQRIDDKIVLIFDYSSYCSFSKKIECEISDSIKYLDKNEFQKLIKFLESKYYWQYTNQQISYDNYQKKKEKLYIYMLNAASRVVHLSEI